LDLGKLRRTEEDALAETVEAGLGILAGVVPATGPAGADAEPAGVPQPPSARQAADRVVELWRRMGWPVAGGASAGPGGAAAQVVLTPACGMAGAAPGYPREAMARCREAARLLPELMEEGKG